MLNIFLFPAAQAGIAARHHNQVGSIASDICYLVASFVMCKQNVNLILVLCTLKVYFVRIFRAKERIIYFAFYF